MKANVDHQVYKTLGNQYFDYIYSIDIYESSGGYSTLNSIKTKTPQEAFDQIEASGFRVKDNCAQTLAQKWQRLPANRALKKYLVCNASDPVLGNFRDRYLIERNPHLLIEGIILSAWILGIDKAYVYLREEYFHQTEILQRAVDEGRKKGYLGQSVLGSEFNFDIVIHRGADAPVEFDQTSIISMLEGKSGFPKNVSVTFPEVSGFRGYPTIIEDVESFMMLPRIISLGADEFKKVGTTKSPGTKMQCVSGDVNQPGVVEIPMGVSIPELIEQYCEGVREGLRPKAILVPGSIMPVILPSEMEGLKLDYENAREIITGGSLIVIDESRDICEILMWVLEYYQRSTCGQCTPCREGIAQMCRISKLMMQKKSPKASRAQLHQMARTLFGQGICSLVNMASTTVLMILEKFEDEFTIRENDDL